MTNLHAWFDSFVDPKHTEAWISLIAGAIGAVVGAMVGTASTIMINGSARKREMKERLQTLAFSTFTKLGKIYSVTGQIRDHMAEQFEELRDRDPDIPLSMKFRGMNRLSGPLEITSEELWAVLRFADSKALKAIQSLDWGFNALLDSVDMYRNERADLLAKQKPIAAIGVVGTIALTQEEHALLTVQGSALDGEIAMMWEHTVGIHKDTFEALRQIIYAKKRPMGQFQSIRLPEPGPDKRQVKIRAVDGPNATWLQRLRYEKGWYWGAKDDEGRKPL